MQTLQIITKRPIDMPFKTYRALRSETNRQMKRYLKGRFIWYSKNNYPVLHPLSSKEYNRGTFYGHLKQLIRNFI